MMDISQPDNELLVDISPTNENAGTPSTLSEPARLPSNSGISTSPNNNGGSNKKFTPPPYNLSVLCSKTAVGKPGGYEKCVEACLPSQCSLVSENKPYEVCLQGNFIVRICGTLSRYMIHSVLQPMLITGYLRRYYFHVNHQVVRRRMA